MYDQIADVYLEIFPLNQAFLTFIPEYLGKPGSAVLDLGCGPGDYVDQFARAGYRASGIDSSTVMMAQAQIHKQGHFEPLSFEEIDQLDDHFDCIYCVGNSLSYLPLEGIPRFMDNIHRLLHARGSFILQVVNWDKYRLTGSAEFGVKMLSDGRSFHRCYECVRPGEVIFHTGIQQGDEIQGSWAAPLYPKYQQTMVIALETAGLKVTGQFGDYQKTPFDPASSPALILTAQKE